MYRYLLVPLFLAHFWHVASLVFQPPKFDILGGDGNNDDLNLQIDAAANPYQKPIPDDLGQSSNPVEVVIDILPQDANNCTSERNGSYKVTTCNVPDGQDIYTCSQYQCTRQRPDGARRPYYKKCYKDGHCELCQSYKPQGPDYCGPIPSGLDLFL